MARLNDAINAIDDRGLPFPLFYFSSLLTGAADLSIGSFFGRPFGLGALGGPLLEAAAELFPGGAVF